jgi:hypothetical protein
MYLFHANLLAVLAAAVIQWLLGWLWFGMLFNKQWKALVGVPEGAKPTNVGTVMGLIFVGNLILSFALVQMIVLTGWTTFSKGTFVGVVCGLGFVFPPLMAQHLSEKKPFKLFGINVMYWLFAMLISGGMLAVWH